MHDINAILAIAYRDYLKFLRDKARIIATFIFPIVFIAILGGSLQANLGESAGYNFLLFTFTGVIGQTLFQSTAMGVISLVEDRENDFSQEIFVSPVSRYSIIFGKILGESFVSVTQILGILAFGVLFRIPISWEALLMIVPSIPVVCLLGGAFGILVLSRLQSQKASNQIFPFIIFPQIFLAGIFSPIKDLPFYLLVLSRMSPLTYAVDLVRSLYYFNSPDYDKVVLFSPLMNMAVIGGMFLVFFVLGTISFVNSERNK